MKLYVGKISFNVSNQDLCDLFATAGTVVSANIIEDRETGRSRGFGFVEMSSPDEGNAAITEFNGKEVDGRSLKVNEAKPRENGGGGRGGGGGNFGRNRSYGGDSRGNSTRSSDFGGRSW
jgi:RNA recognition motif-containing protein